MPNLQNIIFTVSQFLLFSILGIVGCFPFLSSVVTSIFFACASSCTLKLALCFAMHKVILNGCLKYSRFHFSLVWISFWSRIIYCRSKVQIILRFFHWSLLLRMWLISNYEQSLACFHRFTLHLPTGIGSSSLPNLFLPSTFMLHSFMSLYASGRQLLLFSNLYSCINRYIRFSSLINLLL